MNDDRQLIDGYLDGELTADAERHLAEWLAADREHIRQFVRETQLHRQIREAMLARQFQTDALATVDRVAREPWPWPVRALAQLVAWPWAPALRRAWLPLTACVALVAGLAFWWFGPTMGEPVLAEVSAGGVTVERVGQTIAGTAGMRLQFADVLRSGTNAVTITYAPEKTRVELQPGTTLKLLPWLKGKRFDLGKGKIEAVVARQRPFRPMLVHTPQAEARVLGTEFTLAATTNATRLEVTAGEVKLTRVSDRAAVKVAVGHYAVAASNYALAVQPLPGKVLREFWLDLPGDTLEDLRYHARYPNAPSGHDFPPNFESDTNWPSAYGTRTRAYLLPPLTGDYEFRISGNGQIRLWLSPDDDPAERVVIAQIAFTRNRSADEGPEKTRSRQDSGTIPLEAGRRYYIEVAHKYGNGQDQLSVIWKRPEGAEEPVPAEFLAPFVSKPKEKKR